MRRTKAGIVTGGREPGEREKCHRRPRNWRNQAPTVPFSHHCDFLHFHEDRVPLCLVRSSFHLTRFVLPFGISFRFHGDAKAARTERANCSLARSFRDVWEQEVTRRDTAKHTHTYTHHESFVSKSRLIPSLGMIVIKGYRSRPRLSRKRSCANPFALKRYNYRGHGNNTGVIKLRRYP